MPTLPCRGHQSLFNQRDGESYSCGSPDRCDHLHTMHEHKYHNFIHYFCTSSPKETIFVFFPEKEKLPFARNPTGALIF